MRARPWPPIPLPQAPADERARRLLAAGLGLALALTPANAAAALPALTLETLATGLASPVAVTHAGDERLFVTLQAGRIVIFDDGRVLDEPFLDIADRVSSNGERGLLSVAFHPGYAANGWFFVNYTNREGDTVLARFSVSEDPDVAAAASEVILLVIDQPFSNHNGGQIQFGPDGFLYVATGDGGSGDDPRCHAQNPSSLLGKMLRLDVDRGVPPFYAVPADNPFVGSGVVRDEIWALGLRNPWRFSFDRATGDLFIGDVGQGRREEVSFQPAASGGGENYGWKMMEGSLCRNQSSGCGSPIPPCGSPEYTGPILEYANAGDDCAITGGYVYRGGRVPDLVGHYLYGDFCSGALWAARRSGGSWQTERISPSAPNLTSFGEDSAGEIYLVTGGGTLYRLGGPGGEDPGPCFRDANTLCLTAERFRVRVSWRTQLGESGPGVAVPMTEDAGYFWFFSPNNPEIFVKVLDACFDPYHHFWVFAGGLTDVETRITVLDTATGQVRRYDKDLGLGFDPIRDTGAFATCP